MALCPPCREGTHDRHIGKFEVHIQRKGNLGSKSRPAECLCSACVITPRLPKTSSPSEPPHHRTFRPHPLAIEGPDRTYTDDPCPLCHDPSHWVAVEPFQPGPTPAPPADKYTRVSCPGCGVCRWRAKAVREGERR